MIFNILWPVVRVITMTQSCVGGNLQLTYFFRSLFLLEQIVVKNC